MTPSLLLAASRDYEASQPVSTRDRAARDWRISRYAARFSALRPSLLIYPKLPASVFTSVAAPPEQSDGACAYPGCGKRVKNYSGHTWAVCPGHNKQLSRRGWMSPLGAYAPKGSSGLICGACNGPKVFATAKSKRRTCLACRRAQYQKAYQRKVKRWKLVSGDNN